MNIALLAAIMSHEHLLSGAVDKINAAVKRQDFEEAYRLSLEAGRYLDDLKESCHQAWQIEAQPIHCDALNLPG
jgi:hypothetical protein